MKPKVSTKSAVNLNKPNFDLNFDPVLQAKKDGSHFLFPLDSD